MKTLITLKRSVLGLAATGVLASSLFAAAPAGAAAGDLAAQPDPAGKCWTLPDGSVKCKACVIFDGGKHCFLYTKKGPTNPAPAPPPPGGAYLDYVASGLS